MRDLFAQPFMLRALVAGLLMGLAASYLGVFVVQRRMSFLGDGLAHAAFGGVALGLLLGADPLWVAVPFTVLAALAIMWTRERTRLGEDTSVGVLFAVSVALGVVFLSLKAGYTADAFGFLFGSILSIRASDLVVAAAVVLVLGGAARLWGRWAYATFDRELAQADRLRPVRDDYVLIVSIAVTVVIGVKLVGIVLLAAFLVVPAASARLVSPTLARMTGAAAAYALSAVVAGLVLSYALDVPSGAMIILVQAALFFGTIGVRALRAG